MGRPQLGLPRLRVWATGIAIGPDHTPLGGLCRWKSRTGGVWFAETLLSLTSVRSYGGARLSWY